VSHENTLSSAHLMAALALAHDEIDRLRRENEAYAHIVESGEIRVRSSMDHVLPHLRQLLADIRARGDAGRLLPRVEKIEGMIRSGGSGTATNE
jgi:hypothetical protein